MASLSNQTRRDAGRWPIAEDATEAAVKAAHDFTDQVADDTVSAVARRREMVRFTADDAEVRYIAHIAARLAIGLARNPDREG